VLRVVCVVRVVGRDIGACVLGAPSFDVGDDLFLLKLNGLFFGRPPLFFGTPIATAFLRSLDAFLFFFKRS